MDEINGYTYNIGRIWNTRCSGNGVRIFYMETEQVHSKHSNDRVRPRFQEVGRYYYKADRPTKDSSNGN